jgi:zinc protease
MKNQTSFTLALAAALATFTLPQLLREPAQAAAPQAIPHASASPAIVLSPKPNIDSSAATLPNLKRHVSAPVPTSTTEAALPTPNPATRVQSRTLSNGLKVIVVEDHAAGVVQTGVWYRFGALNETPGKTGLAHGLEHMMFRGTPSLSEGGLDDVSARLGLEENANTANDYTHFYFVLPAQKLGLALSIEADRMRNLLLSDHDWQLEKGAVLSEYDGDLGAPATRLLNDLCLAATPTPVCGLGALGTRSDIVSSKADDLKTYYDRYYHPNNATLVIVGDVKADDAFAEAQHAFGNIPEKTVRHDQRTTPLFFHHTVIRERGDYPYVLADSVYQFPGDKEADAGAAAIIDGIINDQRSPMYEALVLSGITLGYETSANSNLRGGLEHIIFVMAPKHKPDEARRAFHAALHSMLEHGIPADLFAAAKRAAALNAIYSLDSISGLGDRVGYAIGVEERKDPSEDDQIVANTSLAQTTEFAKRAFANPLVIGELTPERPKPGAKAPDTGSAVNDNFANRAPSGPVVEADWVKAALASSHDLISRVKPTHYILENGINLYVQPVHENPTIFVSGTIDGTPRFERARKTGLRDFAADLMSYGSEKYDFDAQHRLTDELGASLELGSNFGVHGLARDLPQLLDLLADGEENPTFPQRYVKLVRDQKLTEIAAHDRDPDYQARHAFASALFGPNDPTVREATQTTINNINPADLHDYARRYFRPDLTSISIVGDITPEVAKAAVEKAFAHWNNIGPRPDVSLPATIHSRSQSVHVAATRRLVTVHLGQAAVKRDSPDFEAFNLLNMILGGGGTFDTRLMHEIRERRGLVYSVSSSLQSGRYRGILSISLSASPEHVKSAIALAKEQLHRLTTEAPSQEELDRARQRLIGSSLVAEESTETIVSRLDTISSLHLPIDTYQTLAERYGHVTPDQILQVAKRYLRPDQLVSISEGP